MPQAYRLVCIVIFSFTLLQSKAEASVFSTKDSASKSHHDTINSHILKPIIGIGTGVMSYYGNVKPSNSYLQNPLLGRIGYDLDFAMKMNRFTEFNLYALWGTVAVDERSTTVNWSFQSELRGGGFHLLFKILPKDPVCPYIIVGFESFEFLSKLDAYNQYGQKYYFWSDGTIRSLPQTAPNASSASILYQDYTYESDIRSMNLDGSGKYTEQTFAIPVGVGFMFKVGKKVDFMVGTTLHYTFTDHIDGLTPNTPGVLKGSTYNDKFLFSSIMLRYDLTSLKNLKDENEDKDEERYEGVDFTALMNEDNDHDGVRDWDDSCAGTPPGVAVDKKGCPLDDDHDGVPNYKDKQLDTPPGSIVNADGVALTDSMLLRQYQMYVDSTGQFATVQIDSNGVSGYHPSKANATTNTNATRYTIELGHYSKGVPADVMDKFLSVPDVKSTMLKDSSSVYTAGDYTDYNAAKNRQDELVKQGLTDAKVVYRQGDDFVPANGSVGTNPSNVTTTNPENKTGTNPTNVTTTNPENKTGTNPTNVTTTNPENKTGTNPTNVTTTNPENKTGTNPTNVTTTNPTNTTTTNPTTGPIVYRVQLGAYKHKLSKNIYSDVSDVVEMKTENGYYTYSAGSFTNYQDAANYRAKLITQGFTDAFIKAYQHGKRIPLEKAGAIYVKPEKEDMSEQPTKEEIAMDKTQVSFKVQVGAFKGTPPANLQAVYKLYSNLSTDRDENGITHYVVGPYADYKAAKDMKAEAEASGVKGAFIVAYFKGKPIPVSEALDILKQ